ncbi:MAG TPA: DUF4058 domain-containing protein [Gemmataceae bacterium]
MPIHDWTKVDDGVFHDFHHEWISRIKHVLNNGILPPDYYAMADQVAGPGIPDVLGLKRQGVEKGGGGAALLTAVPKLRFHDRATSPRKPVRRPKRVAVRHVTGDRVVALVEIVSTGNKSSRAALRAFVDKLVAFVDEGIHLMILDLFPPTARDPDGLYPLIWSHFHKTAFQLPSDKPLTLASYNAGPIPESFVEPAAVGDRLIDVPLYLTPDEYVNVPLEAAYEAAWAEVPRRWRDAITA